jgi:hypothetical protein
MKRHPNKEIDAALQLAEQHGWRIDKSPRGHCWGIIKCPGGRGGCMHSVMSTPRNPQAHAQQLKRWIEKCPHQ